MQHEIKCTVILPRLYWSKYLVISRAKTDRAYPKNDPFKKYLYEEFYRKTKYSINLYQ